MHHQELHDLQDPLYTKIWLTKEDGVDGACSMHLHKIYILYM